MHTPLYNDSLTPYPSAPKPANAARPGPAFCRRARIAFAAAILSCRMNSTVNFHSFIHLLKPISVADHYRGLRLAMFLFEYMSPTAQWIVFVMCIVILVSGSNQIAPYGCATIF